MGAARREILQLICSIALRLILCMNLPDLLLNIHPLHPFHLLSLVQLPIIIRGRLLPPCLLLFADDGLTCHAVEDVGALRRKAFQIGSYVRSGKIGGRCTEIGFLPLFFPARVQQLNCKISLISALV